MRCPNCATPVLLADSLGATNPAADPSPQAERESLDAKDAEIAEYRKAVNRAELAAAIRRLAPLPAAIAASERGRGDGETDL
jgi:hypothetical protein